MAAEGAAALRRGDGTSALAIFERVSAVLPPDQTPWLMLAQCHRLLDDAAAEEAALQKLLDADIRDLPAMLFMGDLKARTGDDRAAANWYRAALNAAAQRGETLSGLAPLLDNARRYLGTTAQRFEAHLLSSLDGTGKPPRIAEALDLLLGRKQIYHQSPSSFYFPGLPQRQFYEREELPWLAQLEAAAPAMRDELESILAETSAFDPYVQTAPGRPSPNNHLRDDPNWGALYLWKGGERQPANADRAPATMAALEGAPIPRIAQRSPMALYSLLKPGTHIKPHTGLLNTRLICHIPLIAPEGCALRVGNETREWRFGEALIFDDSIEHEAWNRGASNRYVLLFEIWRPEIGEEERTALTALFEAINDYAPPPQDAG